MTERDQSEYNSHAVRLQFQERMLNAPPGVRLAVGVDIDETLSSTVPYILRLLNRILTRWYGVEASRLPILEEMNAKGGSSGVYPPFFSTRQEFEVLMELVRGHRGVNVRPHALVPDIGAHVTRVAMDDRVMLLGSITARPAITGVVRATRDQLVGKMGLPEFPILARPLHTPIEETSAWKIEEMRAFARLRPDILTLIIDDSAGLVSAIKEYNQRRGANDPHLAQIVYPGPMTIGKIERGEIVEDPANGIYIGAAWEHMLTTMTRILAEA